MMTDATVEKEDAGIETEDIETADLEDMVVEEEVAWVPRNFLATLVGLSNIRNKNPR